MFRRYKYDIAISVAAEDVRIAELINTELQKRQIHSYFYAEENEKDWGKHILEITTRIYGRSARYVLMITSEHFVRKYWADIEMQAIRAYNRKRNCILPLRIGETPVEVLRGFVHKQWRNNPEQIADFIKQRLQKEKCREKLIALFVFGIIGLTIFGALQFFKAPILKRAEPQGISIQVEDTIKPTPVKRTIMPPKLVQKKGGPLVPAGEFTMGSDNLNAADGPAHVVNMHSFYISPTEVTIQQYNEYCLAVGKAIPVQQPHRCADSCYPVSNISWDDAKGYCDWVRGRLPTEAEWEYAASGGLQNKYSGGNTAAKVAVYRQDKPSRVTLKDCNSLGLYDMSGNVAEWCADWFDAEYYKTSPLDNPAGPIKTTEKVVRGGAYNSEVYELPVVLRQKALPTTKSPAIGFRVVWDK